MEKQNESPQASPFQQSNTKPQTLSELKHGSFLTSKLFLITLAIVVLFMIAYAGIYLNLGSQLDQISKPSPTPLPAETSVKEGDPTANWKTYTLPDGTFSLLYPPTLKVEGVRLYPLNADTSLPTYVFDTFTMSDGKAIEEFKIIEKMTPGSRNDKLGPPESGFYAGKVLQSVHKIKNVKIDGFPAIEYIVETMPLGRGSSYAHLFKVNKKGLIVVFTSSAANKEEQQKHDQIFIQMVATIEFQDQENQVVCTQDAKMCPDGSYVSRQQPNCEFGACPQK